MGPGLKKIGSNLFFIGALLFCLTLPLPVIWNNISLYFMILGWLISSGAREKWRLLRARKEGNWIVVLYLCYLLSLLYSSDMEEGLSKLETKAAMMVLPFIIYSMDWSAVRMRTVLLTFAVSMVAIAFLMVVFAFYKYTNGAKSNVFFYHDLTEPIDLHAIYFANYLCVGLLFLVFEKTPGITKVQQLTLICSTILLIVMLTAISVMGFVISLGFVALYFSLRKRTGTLLSIGAGFLLLILIVGLALIIPGSRYKIEQIRSLQYQMEAPDSAWNSITMRLAMWECSLPVIKSHPWIGVGVGDENQALQKSYQMKGFAEGIRCNYNVHNQYLSSLMTIGAPGLAVMLLMLFVPALQALRTNDWLWLAFLSLITFSFTTENFLGTQKGAVFFSFFYSLLFVRNKLAIIATGNQT